MISIDPHNPYSNEKGEPLLRRSVIGYLDIMGFSDMILDASERDQEQTTLFDLYKILSGSLSDLAEGGRVEVPHQDLFKIKSFSDNVVVGYPIKDDGEAELGSVIIELSIYQLTLVSKGIFVRGSIHIGDIFIDDNVVFGSGLIEAYECEQQRARDPRIILSESAVAAVEEHIFYYDELEETPHYFELCEDADGELFLNYLFFGLPAEEVENPQYLSLRRHKEIVEERIMHYKRQPNLWNKYAWCANYHNFFCQQTRLEQFSIDMAEHQLKPSLLTPRKKDGH